VDCPRCGQSNPVENGPCTACGALLAESADAPTAIATPAGEDDVTRVATAGDPSEAATEYAAAPPDAPGPPTAQLKAGDRIGERYEILSVLGVGGFGAVYRANDNVLGRTVALKVIHPGLATHPDMIERFKREILLSSKITHKNVVRIHDLGEVGELKFISMAFVEGCDLKSIIERDGPLSPERALPMIHLIAEALVAAHEAGVVHRDLKPQNILVDAEDQAYVADFGISRSVEGGQTMTEAGSVMGTLAYMSPEQARGETADHRSDIYSFGLILYEMLTGTVPFQSDTPLSQLMKRAQEDVPAVDATRPGLPAWLVRVVSRCLARDPSDRYASVAEVVRDLDRQHATVAMRRRVRVRLVQTAAALAIVAALVFAGSRWLGTRPPAEPAAVAAIEAELVLVPFRNVSEHPDDDWTRSGVPRLLRFDLEQSKTLRVVGEERVREIIDGLKLGGAGELDDVAIERLAGVLRVENVLAGDLYRQGADTYRIHARLLRVGAAAINAEEVFEVEGSGPDALFSMVGNLAGRVRGTLGVARVRGAREVAELSTASLDGLRLYNEGIDLVRSGSDVKAAGRLEQALAIDPEFAVARAELAETYDRLGRVDDALTEADKAAADVRDVSDYEFARIRAVRARLAGDDEAALAAYGDLTTLAPNRPSVHLALAQYLEDRGDLEAGLDSANRVVALDPRHANGKYIRGRLLAKLGRTDEGLSDFEEALSIHTQSGNAEGRATVLNGLGYIYSVQGRYTEALEAYESCLEAREQIGDRRGIGVALHNLALTHRDMGRFDEAVARQQRSLEVLEELGDVTELASGYGGLGDIHNRAGHMELAMQAYQTSLDLLRDSGDEAGLAQAFGNLGFIKAALGQYTEAYFFQKNALEKRRTVGHALEIMFSLTDIGGLEFVQGHFEPALAYYSEGLDLARDNGHQAAIAIFSMNLAELYIEQGDYGAALASAAEAVRLTREIGAPSLLVPALKSLADAKRAVGTLDGAAAALAEATELNGELGNPSLSARILTSRGRLLAARHETQIAEETLREAIAVALGANEHRPLLLARLAAADVADSVIELREVLNEAQRTGLDPIVVRARYALARLGADSAEQAITEATRLRMRDVLFAANDLAARSLEGRAAVGHAQAALDTLEEMRRGLEPEVLGAFLSRPATTRFSRDAAEVFRSAGRDDLNRRLENAVDVTAGGQSPDNP
jgi:tetratricopeptide (TPR) repeat protein